MRAVLGSRVANLLEAFAPQVTFVDRDFFGTGVATWTTALVGMYLSGTDPEPD
jgi:hypothetical protein